MAQKDDRPAAITVDGVFKDFALPHERNQSVKSGFTKLFRSKDRRVEVQHALRDIAFEIKQGEFFGIVGRNGGGKSTLLKMLAGIYQPTKGKVTTVGKIVPFIELGVGFNPELTGRENVYLNGALLGFSKKEMDNQYHDIVAFAELEKFMDQKLKNYSSGMQVRLAFSLAIRAEADILLVDEVLAVGDADFQRKCFQYFKLLKKNGKTVVFVTHDMNAVREYCDRAILINKSRIVNEGKPNEIANDYLRLFNTVDGEGDSSKPKNRWGNEQVQFESIKAKAGKDNVTFSFTLKAKEAADDLVVGYRIKDSAGKTLTGASTVNAAQHDLFSLQKGQKVTITSTFPNIFANGVFMMDATIRLSDGVTICDNWDDAASFSIVKDEKTPYGIVPPVDFEFSHE